MKRLMVFVVLLLISEHSSWAQMFRVPKEALEHPLPIGMENLPDASNLTPEEKRTIVFQIDPAMVEAYTRTKEKDPAAAEKMIEEKVAQALHYVEGSFLLQEKIEAVEAANKEIATIIEKQRVLVGDGWENTERMITMWEFFSGAIIWEIAIASTFGGLLIFFGFSRITTLRMISNPEWGVSKTLIKAKFKGLKLSAGKEDSWPAISEYIGLAYGHICRAHLYVEKACKSTKEAGDLRNLRKAIVILREALSEFGISPIDPEDSVVSEAGKAIQKAEDELRRREVEFKQQEAGFAEKVQTEVRRLTQSLVARDEELGKRAAEITRQEASILDREAQVNALSETAESDLRVAQQMVADVETREMRARRMLSRGQNLMAAYADLPPAGTDIS